MADTETNANAMSDRKKEETISWLKDIDLPASIAKSVDIDNINSPFDLATAEEITSKVVEFMLNSTSYVDMEVIYYFQEDFAAWTKQTWEAMNQTIRRSFRLFLREKGVYTGPMRGQIGQQLVRLLDAEIQPEWDMEDLRNMANLCQNSLAYEIRQDLPPWKQAMNTPPAQAPASQAPLPPSTPLPPSAPLPPSEPLPTQTPLPPPAPLLLTNQPNVMTQQRLDAVDNDDAYQGVPPLEFPNQPLDPATAAIFGKLWD